MITLDEQTLFILGRPNFKCARVGQKLIAAKVYAPYPTPGGKSEYEQAITIHWYMSMRDKWGEREWKSRASDELLNMVEG